ncbi:hypothetical protein [Neobacillus niacini]|nr:hypothetical protein [Neobacillus niacini]
MKLKKKRKKNKSWDLIDIGFDLVEPIYLLVRWMVRIFIKVLD